MDLEISDLIKMLSNKVLELSNAGEWNDAVVAAEDAIEKARAMNMGGASDVLGLVSTLEVKGDLHRKLGGLEESRLSYLEALELVYGLPECTETLARINASTGVLYDLSGNAEEAISFYERSLHLHEQEAEPRLDEMADICNNLGFIYRGLGDGDTAEALFQKGLEMSKKVNGEKDPKTAVLYNNLGALYLNAGNEEWAREMLTAALEIRAAALGKEHTDTAQSFSNLALALEEEGNAAQIKEYFQTALDIYEKNISRKFNDYEAVAENFAEFLRSQNENKAANNLEKKAKKNLAKLG